LKKIATAAETYYVSVAPHNSNGPISTVASLHLDTCIPNCFMQEVFVNFLPRYEAVLTNPLVIEDGHASPPAGPGWGTDIDLEALKQYPPNDYVTVESEPYTAF
jgi:galactonate dehydratase